MLKNILSTILLRKKTINPILVMIILLGILSHTQPFQRHEMPEIDLKTVSVIIYYDGASSNEMERLITEPLESK